MLRVVTLLCIATVALGTHLKGVPRLDGRIVGGEDADIDDYPYQLALQIAGNQECGAVIINPNWALTGAQCVGGSILGMTLRAGTDIRNDPSATTGTNHTVTNKIVHPDFDISTVDSDIALLKVNPPFDFTINNIKPINLATEPLADNTDVTTIGWGNTQSGGLPSKKLQSVNIQMVATDECTKAYEGNGVITKNMVCAAASGKDACQGDSGGPLVFKGNPPGEAKDHLLVGLVSWGRGCALADYPGVYTSVPAFENWILANAV